MRVCVCKSSFMHTRTERDNLHTQAFERTHVNIKNAYAYILH